LAQVARSQFNLATYLTSNIILSMGIKAKLSETCEQAEEQVSQGIETHQQRISGFVSPSLIQRWHFY